MKTLTHIKDIVDLSFRHIEAHCESKDDLTGIPSGFCDLDAQTSGFQPSDFIIIGARPSMGKTNFCLGLAQHAAISRNIPVAFFSLGTSKQQLVQRMLCSEASIDANRLRAKCLQNNDWTNLATAMDKLGEAPIYLDDSPYLDISQVAATVRGLKEKNEPVGLIIVDYIQLLPEYHRTSNSAEEISNISCSLKTLALEFHIPVIAVSQLPKAVENRKNKRPMLSDLPEFSCINADMIMFLYRDEYYDPETVKRGEAEIIIAKQRYGPTGVIELLYQSNIARFSNKNYHV